MSLYKDGKRRTWKVHRLVALAFLRRRKGKDEVNHIDGDNTNNALKNLEWVTRAENQRHAWKNGLCHGQPKGWFKKGHDERRKKHGE